MAKKQYYCNPINVNYRYQFNRDPRSGGQLQICREAADPSMILFRGRYYIFASMQLSVWVSDDLVSWETHPLPEELPLYDYAPDVRVVGDYVYFCASSNEHNCDFWRTKDILNGPYEKVEGSFPFWDPNLFADDDGRLYFYWGCSNAAPIYGVELDPETMKPLEERRELIFGDPYTKGYERIGYDNTIFPASEEEIEGKYQAFLKTQAPRMAAMQQGESGPDAAEKFAQLQEKFRPQIRGMFSNQPYIEGAWMTKHNGRYYLQYACPGTQYNTYADAVYVGDAPLGPFVLAENNPFSYKPGGFIPGAGHGSTMQDKEGNWWHTATMRISNNHDFERRVGIFPAGFDADGKLYCDQRYADWPIAVLDTAGGSGDPSEAGIREPDWMLLSQGKRMRASSEAAGHPAALAAEENVKTFWKPVTADRSEYLLLDLGSEMRVNAVQINFADDKIDIPSPGRIQGSMTQARYIDGEDHRTQWLLEGSCDGSTFTVIEDKTDATTDLPHDLIIVDDGEGAKLRYLRLSQMSVPYDQIPCISGLRVFGHGNGTAPAAARFQAARVGEIDMDVTIAAAGSGTKEQHAGVTSSGDDRAFHGQASPALGYNILFGSAPDKLYHSYMVFAPTAHDGALVKETRTDVAAADGSITQRIGALIKGREYYVRVDAFNENGITPGEAVKL